MLSTLLIILKVNVSEGIDVLAHLWASTHPKPERQQAIVECAIFKLGARQSLTIPKQKHLQACCSRILRSEKLSFGDGLWSYTFHATNICSSTTLYKANA